jgi:ribonuclease HI
MPRKAAEKTAIEQNKAGEGVKATAMCDGRGNAGTGARAAVLYVGDGLKRDGHARAQAIPATTNIVAEHLAMELAKDHEATEVVIYNDSQTPVNHLNGKYKVRQEHLIPIVAKTWEMGSDFLSIEIRWTGRENTKAADALCRAVAPEWNPVGLLSAAASTPVPRATGLAHLVI